MIAGLEEISSGELRIDGRRVNELPPRDRDIGMVFQSYALYPHMTVRENLAFGLMLRKTPREEIDRRVADAGKMLELGHLLDRKPKALSGGQRQRVAIGRAIVRSPKVFLFDEPLSNLDAALRVQMRAEILSLHRRLGGTTMVYVTHDQVEAMTLATRIAVLDAGVLQQVGPPAELFHRPANRFVAGFIGSPAMNFVSGTVADGLFTAPGLELALPGVPLAGPATLGLRPQDLAIGERGLRGEVQVVEAMGWEAYLHVETAAGRLVVRVEGPAASQVRSGEQVALAIDPAKVHLFGPDEQAVRWERPSDGERVSA
jgi:multiple sugar transport system ATP-binding protein